MEADDRYDAEQMVSDGWHNGEYTLDNVLDADNFIDVEFVATPVENGLAGVVAFEYNREGEECAEKTNES